MTLRQQLEQKGVTLTPKLAFKSTAPLAAETLALLQTHRDDLLKDLAAPDAVPRPPWQLERLISAACADVLPKDTTTLSDGLVPDLARYTLGWAAAYLVGDRVEAERRLWQVYRVWQGVN